MDRDVIMQELTEVMRRRFRLPELEITPATTAAEVPGWDSLAHIDLIVAVETHFGVTVSTREVRGMQNVGALIDLVARKIA
jgi:acyl carrier protein